jgi:hypothetical protein
MSHLAGSIQYGVGRAFQLAQSQRPSKAGHIRQRESSGGRGICFDHCTNKCAGTELHAECLRDLPAMACSWGSTADNTNHIADLADADPADLADTDPTNLADADPDADAGKRYRAAEHPGELAHDWQNRY